MGSFFKQVLKARKELPNRKQRKRRRRENEEMISKTNLQAFRLLMGLFFMAAIVSSRYAPQKRPKLPEGFCEHGDVTATTGECMCHWQHKDGCIGSGCEYQMGLSFYHYSCKDCKCVPEP